MKRSRRRLMEIVTAYALLAPVVLLVGGFAVYVLGWQGVESGLPSALRYWQVLADPSFATSVGATGAYLVGTVAASLALGTWAAVVLHRRTGFPRWGLLIILPWAYPSGPGLLGWERFLLPPVHTAYSDAVGRLHLVVDAVLGHGSWQALVVAGFTVWRGSAIVAVLVLAALSGVPRELEEALTLDGSGRWLALRAVFLPMLRPVLGVSALLLLAGATADLGNLWWMSERTGSSPILWTEALSEGSRGGDGGAAAARMMLSLPILAPLVGMCLRCMEASEDVP